MAGLEFRLADGVLTEHGSAGQTVRERAEEALEYGRQMPFDAPEWWWNSSDDLPPPRPRDWAHKAARGVMAELQGRVGIKDSLGDVPHALARDVVLVIAEVIRLAESRRRRRTPT